MSFALPLIADVVGPTSGPPLSATTACVTAIIVATVVAGCVLAIRAIAKRRRRQLAPRPGQSAAGPETSNSDTKEES
jgi:threonine/homoserine/homoserine lactone efflux protein